MLDRLELSHFFSQKDPTHVRLTLEFLSSLHYTTRIGSASTTGTVKFRMFNREYKFTTDQLAEVLQFPYGEGVICEAPLETDWMHKVGKFWEQLMGHPTDSF